MVSTIVQRGDYEQAFLGMKAQQVDAVFAGRGPVLFLARKPLIDLAAKYGLPAVWKARVMMEEGGLLSYGPHFADLYRRVASFVDRIVKGANPGDLPVEQPTKFELVINRKTATALGLSIPPSLLLRADQVVE
jgi:putative ABC transport system substrate-binding protein